MTISVGQKLPDATFTVMTADGPGPITIEELTAGKKLVLFAVPGAFTPTCSAKHLPGYVECADAFASAGVDAIACVSVNDVFVMHAWGKDQNVGDKILMLADGNGAFAEALGLTLDARGFGMGLRSQRYAMVIEDGILTSLNVEEAGSFHVSSAEHMLTLV